MKPFIVLVGFDSLYAQAKRNAVYRSTRNRLSFKLFLRKKTTESKSEILQSFMDMPISLVGKYRRLNPKSEVQVLYRCSIYSCKCKLTDIQRVISRDYDSANAIKIWFKNCCDKIATRQAIITIEVEGREPITYRYERSEEE